MACVISSIISIIRDEEWVLKKVEVFRGDMLHRKLRPVFEDLIKPAQGFTEFPEEIMKGPDSEFP